jgi:UDP-N-acetyl-D-mannosaminuronic acid dehydrogenase
MNNTPCDRGSDEKSTYGSDNLRFKKIIAVIGMGYVGIPAAVSFADTGFNVIGIQRRSKRSGWKIDYINEGRCPIGGNEPELPEMLQRVVKKGMLHVTDDISVVEGADIILIDVDTPTDEENIPRYDSLKSVCHQAGKYLCPGKIIILESTVAPGTTEHLVKPILEEKSGLKAGLPDGFGLCYSYERVMVGRLIHNIREYPKIVGGIDEESTRIGIDLYRTIVRGGVYGTDIITAEVSKTVENAYRDVQIAFANEVALLCESLGIDVYEVRDFVNGLPNDPTMPHANPVRNMHFPGAGVGGHCLPKDTWLLKYGEKTYGNIHEKFIPSLLIDARYLNTYMPVHMVDLLEVALFEAGKPIHKSTVCVLGYAFLPNSDDPRNTPTKYLLKELDKRGAGYKLHDTHIRESDGYCFESELEAALKDCDAVIIMTNHDQYKMITPKQLKELLRTRIVIDGRRLLEAEEYLSEGFIFKAIGRGDINQKPEMKQAI